MQRDGELDYSKAGAEMATRDRSCIDRFPAQFLRQLAQPVRFEPPQIGWCFDLVEKGRGKGCHKAF
jgi:hypothetical protein